MGIYHSVSFTDAGSEEVYYDAAALTFDSSKASSAAQGFGASELTLQDLVQGQSWRLRRIVGKFFCTAGASEGGSATNVTAVQVAYGFIVCKTDAFGSPTTQFDTTNPLAQDSADDPWIWRRSWVLNPQGAAATPTFVDDQWWGFPKSNVGYGSVLDGPHIDSKSNRIIGPEERLFGVMAIKLLGTDNDELPPVGTSIQVRGYLDYRLLGSMYTTVGNRRNASR